LGSISGLEFVRNVVGVGGFGADGLKKAKEKLPLPDLH